MSWRALLSHNLQEIRIHFCQQAQSSEGLRNFITKNYTDLKRLNPKLPLMVREAHGIEPVIYARYDWGQEEKKVVTNLSEQEVEEKLKELCLMGTKLDRSPESDLNEDDVVSSYNRPKNTYRTIF
ncbi:putative NADH dehydrogenase [Cavenderia fasciculata]|uniref:NADH dehydrogenase n=1 Tax=Cavenderia fasciculata TaxID=261658 RepID=F4PQ87_CACFS|nr:putative NADH dehydrogenase [Cavenderia fasciculata]EGG22550.1 putative NADH dehydrogenase [Cavenderia fasciculata]|eukprot:XP_004360401.1 putative NADH dehydrogenase [Cavenderia fasciculata]